MLKLHRALGFKLAAWVPALSDYNLINAQWTLFTTLPRVVPTRNLYVVLNVESAQYYIWKSKSNDSRFFHYCSILKTVYLLEPPECSFFCSFECENVFSFYSSAAAAAAAAVVLVTYLSKLLRRWFSIFCFHRFNVDLKVDEWEPRISLMTRQKRQKLVCGSKKNTAFSYFGHCNNAKTDCHSISSLLIFNCRVVLTWKLLIGIMTLEKLHKIGHSYTLFVLFLIPTRDEKGITDPLV